MKYIIRKKKKKPMQAINVIKKQNAWLKFVNFDISTNLRRTTTTATTTRITTATGMLPCFESLLCTENYTKHFTYVILFNNQIYSIC